MTLIEKKLYRNDVFGAAMYGFGTGLIVSAFLTFGWLYYLGWRLVLA